jgi:hypothetical protein
VNQTSAGTSASISTPLENSQTAGSQAATSWPWRRMSISAVMLLATPLTNVSTTQKPTSKVRCQGSMGCGVGRMSESIAAF